MTAVAASRPVAGALWALLAVLFFSANDVLIKYLSGDYPLYQLVFFRSTVALIIVLGLIVPLTGNFRMLRTRRLGIHFARAACVVVANLSFFVSLAVLPLADAVALFFVAPPLLAVMSVVFLGETVGPRRWIAIALGFLGVLIVLRPGTTTFQLAALLPILAAVAYAGLHILTRHIRDTENATAMVFYIQVSFILVSGLSGLLFGDGALNQSGHPSLQFLFRGWIWPSTFDFALTVGLGVTSAFGGFAISQAYRLAEASVVAPFEYVAMPLAVILGLVLFDEVPDVVAIIGIVLILGSGLGLIWREAVARRTAQTIANPRTRSIP